MHSVIPNHALCHALLKAVDVVWPIISNKAVLTVNRAWPDPMPGRSTLFLLDVSSFLLEVCLEEHTRTAIAALNRTSNHTSRVAGISVVQLLIFIFHFPVRLQHAIVPAKVSCWGLHNCVQLLILPFIYTVRTRPPQHRSDGWH
jgi:hypothetical protein